MLGKFERGEITPDEWRKFRLLRGTYSQRQDADYQMLRIKIPQGILDAAQLEVLADVSERHSRGFGHISTRQNVQLHFVPLHDMEPAMRRLAEAGMTTREACGNSVRNITACPYAGVARDEVFDVTPYAEAMTRYLLRHPLSSSLPRKFKIAFEGCTSEDHAFTAINDIGWRAALAPDGSGRRGFKVAVAGGTAIMCRSGASLFEFLPASDILMVAEAVVRVFHRYGDYEHKQRNRLKFLLKTMGWDKWFAAFQQELADVRASGAREAAVRSRASSRRSASRAGPGRSRPRWRRSPRWCTPPPCAVPASCRTFSRRMGDRAASGPNGCARTCSRRSRASTRS